MRQLFFYRSYTYAKRCEDKLAEMYRCAVGPKLYRIFTKDSRQVRIKWTLFYLDNIILFSFLFFMIRKRMFTETKLVITCLVDLDSDVVS